MRAKRWTDGTEGGGKVLGCSRRDRYAAVGFFEFAGEEQFGGAGAAVVSKAHLEVWVYVLIVAFGERERFMPMRNRSCALRVEL
jgi:hypothetical protein